MLASVLNSDIAIAVNVQIVKAFVQLREMVLANKDLAKRFDEMERHFIQYANENNVQIEEIYKQLDYLKDITKPGKVGFR